ncbi:MAG TPA: acetyl-CoA decarbonylase/synthase complex subunit gamma, partial [Deltaproteobacteria bacterium]|nr:acetyl-CoA decarbonylase/synthase complex subunit gamma [Deltaproteobacteria bacterium]
TIGVGDYAVKIGGETVMFRHEKTFINPPGLAAIVTTDEDDASIDGKISRFKELQYERVGLILRPELFALKDTSGDAGKFTALVNKVKDACEASLILMSEKPDVMKAALDIVKDKKPLIYAATEENVEDMGNLAKESECPIAVKGSGGYESVIPLTEKLTEMGLKDIVIDTGSRTPYKAFEDQVIIRKAALQDRFRPLGFPTITLPAEMTDDPMYETLLSAMFVAKYGALIVMSDFQPESLFPLLLERLNIYTDPQRPMTAEEGIYPIGNPDENSPVLVTCNFSLTYFIVSGEIEGSRVPSWLCVADTEGLSVLTAWAAGKFTGESVGTFINKCGIADKVKHKNLIIPGYAAAISGELEEELPDWKILIGPREASQITSYLKNWKPE